MPAVAAFASGAVVSLLASWLLVTRLERVGERLGLSETLLGIVAALAADAPEITAAVSAITGRTTLAGAWACGLAVLLGLPDQIWATTTHLAFIATVATVSAVAIASSAIISKARC